MPVNGGHRTANANANNPGTHMDKAVKQQQRNYKGEDNAPFAPSDSTDFPFPGLMNIGMEMNNRSGAGTSYSGAMMAMMRPGTDQSYHRSGNPATRVNHPRSTQNQQQQPRDMVTVSLMSDTKPAMNSPPSLLARKRADVIASLKQRASSQNASSTRSSPVQARNRSLNLGAPQSPTAAGKRSFVPASTEQPAPSAWKKPTLTKANTATGFETSARDTNKGNKDRIYTPQPEGRKPLERKTTDVDRLFAECRATAENSTKSGNRKGSTDTPSLRRVNTDVPDPKGHEENSYNYKESIEKGKYNSDRIGHEDFFSGKEKQVELAKNRERHGKDEGDGASTAFGQGLRSDKRPNQSGSVPERRLHEPPKRTSTVDDSIPLVRHGNSLTWRKDDDRQILKSNSSKPAAQSVPAPLPQKPEPEHDFMHLSPSQVEEIKEWLVITGFHDKEYRRKLVARRRKLAALQADMDELMREEQEEKQMLFNHMEASRSSFPPGTPQPQLSVERILHDDSSPFNYSKNKPSAPEATSANAVPVVSEIRTEGHVAAATGANEENNHREVEHPAEYPVSPAVGQKRSVPSHDEQGGGQPKMARTSTNNDNHPGDNAKDTKIADENIGGVTIKEQSTHRDREVLQRSETDVGPPRGRGAHLDFESTGDSEGYPDYNKSHPQSPYRGRGRARGRGGRGSGYATRAGMRGGGVSHFTSPRSHHPIMNKWHMSHENTRFFLIKSLSYGYIEDSQQDGTWATQLRNVGKLIEAYNSTPNVILFFSVNQSKAFQGYARMESLPDAHKVARPEWASRLPWELSAPFRIKWLNLAETRFSWVAHLKNEYREDSAVFVGRDGQEIDPHSGTELCVLLDEHGVKGKT